MHTAALRSSCFEDKTFVGFESSKWFRRSSNGNTFSCMHFIADPFCCCRHLEALSVAAVARCLRTSLRSPIAPKFWDCVEELYKGEATTYKDIDENRRRTLGNLRDNLWPILIDCRVQYKMFDEALQLLDTYCKVSLSKLDH